MVPRLHVSGFCQVAGMRHALEAFLPSWEVEYLPYPPDTDDGKAAFAAKLKQGQAWASADSFSNFDELAALAPDVQCLRWPQVVFPAFHPDIVLAWQGDAPIQSCGHNYNSAIVLWSYLNGIDEGCVLERFNSDIFDHLGYFDQWQPSIERLKKQFENCSLSFEQYYLSIKRVGIFMHSHDHAKISSIAQVARQVARVIGGTEPSYSDSIPYILDDALMHDSIWPVYTEIASQYSVVGNYVWRIRNVFFTSLKQYIESSYASYREAALHAESVLCDRFLLDDRYDILKNEPK